MTHQDKRDGLPLPAGQLIVILALMWVAVAVTPALFEALGLAHGQIAIKEIALIVLGALVAGLVAWNAHRRERAP